MKVSLKIVSDHKLLRGLDELVAKSRHDEADLLAYLAEVDPRQLYLEQGPNRGALPGAQSLRGVVGLWDCVHGAVRRARALPPGRARRRAPGVTSRGLPPMLYRPAA